MSVHKVTGRARKEMRKSVDALWKQFRDMPKHERENFGGIHVINTINGYLTQLGLPRVSWLHEIRKVVG